MESRTEPVNDGGLEKGVLSLTDVVMQAVTHMGPAIGLATSLGFVVSLAGVTAPLAYFFAFLVVLTVGIAITQLAKNFPSAGGYFTYVSRTIHPRAGLLTAWIFLLYDPLAGTINLAFLGFIVEGFLKAKYDVQLSWWIVFLIGTVIVTAFVMGGAKVSARALVTLGVAEIAIVMALALGGLLNPGPGGANLDSFNPGNALSGNGLYLAVVFSILAFSGFESVAPLAEETANPRRNLPIAIIGSILIMGVFYVFCAWGILTGFGTAHATDLATQTQNPLLVVSDRLVVGAEWIALLAIINSALACAIATTSASTRVFFAMGRAGVAPRALGTLNARRTPMRAIQLQTVITLAYGLIVGFWIGPDQEFYVTGIFITLGLIFIYGAGNIGVIRYYLRERRGEFNIVLHGILPAVSTIALVWVGYKSVVPCPLVRCAGHPSSSPSGRSQE